MALSSNIFLRELPIHLEDFVYAWLVWLYSFCNVSAYMMLYRSLRDHLCKQLSSSEKLITFEDLQKYWSQKRKLISKEKKSKRIQKIYQINEHCILAIKRGFACLLCIKNVFLNLFTSTCPATPQRQRISELLVLRLKRNILKQEKNCSPFLEGLRMQESKQETLHIQRIES